MAIYQNVGYSDTGGVTEHALDDATASASGGLSAGSHTQTATAATGWDVAEFNILTFTWQNDMAVYYWTNPAGSYTNSTRSCCLVLGDGTEVLVGEGDTGTATVDLSQYTNEQKSSVQLRGKLNYYLSTVTNAANKGSITATNVIARGLGQGGNVYCEIGKLYEFGGNGFSPISKVYDWNGTAMSLIYSDEEVLYDGGMVVPFEDYGYVSNSSYLYTTRTDNTSNLYGKVAYNLQGNDFYTGYAGWRTSSLIDLSQYSTITIAAKVYTRWDSYNGVRLEFWDASNNSVGTITIQENQKGITTDSEWTFDLSAFNDACKVGVTAWQTYSNGRGAEFNLYKMTLS
ncbi:MAG: hypothetical protein IJP01_06470 [Oscillospiraceae bacterium]|nr:hypothetical protein [Oscillospiraceae bacterium]